MAAVERGFHSSISNKRMRKLEERQAELERLIIIERSKIQVKMSANEIRAFYVAALSKEPLMLVNYLVKEVIVFEDAIHIYFNNPIESLGESQSFSICDKEAIIPMHVQNCLEMREKSIRLTITV